MQNRPAALSQNLSLLSHEQLHDLTIMAANNEKSATLKLLEHLAEVDRRRLYAIRGYSSLWLYVHQALQYSESQTSERISAMRLMVRVPEVKEQIEQNRLSLTSASKLATHVRREKIDPSQTVELLGEIQGKPTREVERVLASRATEPVRIESIRPISAETTRVMIDVDSSFLELLNQVRELRGHAGSTTRELLEMAMKGYVKVNARAGAKQKSSPVQKLAPTQKSTPAPAQKRSPAQNSTLRAPEVRGGSNSNTRTIPTAVKTEVRLRSGNQCEYIDSVTGRRCECRLQLEFDHLISFAMGGAHTTENLRYLCRSHNQLAAIRFYGEKHMGKFFRN